MMYELKSSTHSIEDVKLRKLISILETIGEDVISSSDIPDAGRNYHLISILIEDLASWRNRGIIPAEITIAAELMYNIAISLNGTKLATLAWEVENEIVAEEHEANHNATPEGVPVRDLNECNGVILSSGAPK